MPTYQYACTECDHAFEQVQAFSDSSLTECPECRGRLRKLFGAVGVVFKGSGFYRNDSRKPEGSPSSTSETTSTPSTTKTETKTETKKSDAGSSATKSESTKSESKPAATTAS